MLILPETVEALCALYRSQLTRFVGRAFDVLRPGKPFHVGRHIQAICHQLERIERGEIRNLMVLMPPRHGKSHCVSVAFPVWLMGRDPTKRVVTISYGSTLAERFSLESRRLMESDFVRAFFPDLRIDRKKASTEELLTTLGGGRIATSVGGALTGSGGDVLILDDPIKADDVSSAVKRDAVWNWYWDTARSRLDEPEKGAIILVAQRLHQDDLPGRLMASGEWEVLELPAIETIEREIPLDDDALWNRFPGEVLLPEHMGLAELESIRHERPDIFEAQYQQSPVLAGGIVIRPEWFGSYDGKPRRSAYEGLLQSWDTAHLPGDSNDYSVCTTWGLSGNYIDLLDVYRSRVEYPYLLDAALELREKWKPDVIAIELASSGYSLHPDLRRRGVDEVFGVSPGKGKEARMVRASVLIKKGQVRLPTGAPVREAFLAEVVAFPHGTYDDQADSLSLALHTVSFKHPRLRHCSRYKGNG